MQRFSRRFLDAYREQNLTFWALTTGNEPLNGIVPINRFNSMGWTPMSHREWIGRHMGPRLRASEHNGTLLFAIDDQRIVLPWWMKMVREHCDDVFEIIQRFLRISLLTTTKHS